MLQQVVNDGCPSRSNSPPLGSSFCGGPGKQFILDAASDAIVIVGDVRTKDYGATASAAIGAAQQLDCDANSKSGLGPFVEVGTRDPLASVAVGP